MAKILLEFGFAEQATAISNRDRARSVASGEKVVSGLEASRMELGTARDFLKGRSKSSPRTRAT